MARFNEALAVEQRMLFRVGVHLGEVIVDEEDQNIFGDGVNLAARIQALAEPGGIAVSRAVRDLVELQRRIRLRRRRRAPGQEREPRRPGLPCAAGQDAVGQARRPDGLPQITLRFEGADSTGSKHAFEVALDKLMSRRRAW